MSVTRNTVQKKLILDSVTNLQNHPTAEEVYECVHVDYPSISKATVYRNLKQLSEQGTLKRIESADLADHYDHQCHDHYHIQCTQCNRVYDVEMEYLDELNSMIKNTNGFKISRHDIIFKGICPECRKKMG